MSVYLYNTIQRIDDGEIFSNILICIIVNLHQLYGAVIKAGGYDGVTRTRGWRRLLADMGASSTGAQVIVVRRHYERYY